MYLCGKENPEVLFAVRNCIRTLQHRFQRKKHQMIQMRLLHQLQWSIVAIVFLRLHLFCVLSSGPWLMTPIYVWSSFFFCTAWNASWSLRPSKATHFSWSLSFVHYQRIPCLGSHGRVSSTGWLQWCAQGHQGRVSLDLCGTWEARWAPTNFWGNKGGANNKLANHQSYSLKVVVYGCYFEL